MQISRCARSGLEMVMDRADLEQSFDRGEPFFGFFELFVGAHDRGGGELLGAEAA